jgi:hypothetical protein
LLYGSHSKPEHVFTPPKEGERTQRVLSFLVKRVKKARDGGVACSLDYATCTTLSSVDRQLSVKDAAKRNG